MASPWLLVAVGVAKRGRQQQQPIMECCPSRPRARNLSPSSLGIPRANEFASANATPLATCYGILVHGGSAKPGIEHLVLNFVSGIARAGLHYR